MNVSYDVVRDAISRHNRRLKKLQVGELPRKAGRPRKYPSCTLIQLQAEIRRLQMENDLLKNSTRS